MQTTPSPAAVLFVHDVERVSGFYRAVAGMQVQHADAMHTVLTVAGFELTVHVLRGEPAPPRGPNDTVRVREDSYWKLALPVASLAAAREVAAAHGGALQAPDREWSGRDFRACDGHDPEGNVIQLREALR